MKQIYTNKYREINVLEFIIVKILLIVFIALFTFITVSENKPDAFKNSFGLNPYYSILKFDTVEKTTEDSSYEEIVALEIVTIDFKDFSMLTTNIPVDSNIDYLCGNYKAPISQIYESVDEKCFEESISNIFNVEINEIIKNDVKDGNHTYVKEGLMIYDKYNYYLKTKKKSLNDQFDEFDTFSTTEWSILFSMFNFNSKKVDARSTEEFQKKIILQEEIVTEFEAELCEISTKFTTDIEYHSEFIVFENTSLQKCRDQVNSKLGMLTSPILESSFKFEDNYEKGLWPIDSTFDNIGIPVDSDKDLDGISDEFDLCPDSYSPSTADGCPILDSDFDSVEDFNDLCPYEFAPGTVDGCIVKVDTDGDGILDEADNCPSEYAPDTPDGCQIKLDTDVDGILDDIDNCPNEYAPGTVDGCIVKPKDTDNDGIIDDEDNCPTESGTLNGCPDVDSDGFIDAQDNCPTESGTLNGCPDVDNDGIADYEDTCINGEGTECEPPISEG